MKIATASLTCVRTGPDEDCQDHAELQDPDGRQGALCQPGRGRHPAPQGCARTGVPGRSAFCSTQRRLSAWVHDAAVGQAEEEVSGSDDQQPLRAASCVTAGVSRQLCCRPRGQQDCAWLSPAPRFPRACVRARVHVRAAGSGNLEAIHIIKKTGGTLRESYLDEGYILDKKIGVGQVSTLARDGPSGSAPPGSPKRRFTAGVCRDSDGQAGAASRNLLSLPPVCARRRAQPKRIENARILVANTAMDTDKIKIYGARVRVDALEKVRALPSARLLPCSPLTCTRHLWHLPALPPPSVGARPPEQPCSGRHLRKRDEPALAPLAPTPAATSLPIICRWRTSRRPRRTR